MKKFLIATIISGALISQASYADNYFPSTPSEMSVISIIASPFLSSAALLTPFAALAQASTPIRVTKVEPRANNKTVVAGIVKDIPVEFEADSNVIAKAKLKADDNIMVKDAKIGYVLDYNNLALGIIPNDKNIKNFNQERLN